MKLLTIVLIITGFCCGMTIVAQPQELKKPLPGANGPRLERVEKPPAGIELADARVYDDAQKLPPEAPLPQRFSSGISELRFRLELNSDSPPEVDIDLMLFSQAGEIKLKEGYVGRSAVPAKRWYTASYGLEPETGKFTDGPYQLKLLMNGKVIALVNWTVGEQ